MFLLFPTKLHSWFIIFFFFFYSSFSVTKHDKFKYIFFPLKVKFYCKNELSNAVFPIGGFENKSLKTE
jgi:hypothetical protein